MASRPFTRAVPIIVGALLAIPLLWLGWVAVHIGWYRYYPPHETAFMAERIDEARAKGRKLEIRYAWVPYDRIAPAMKRGIIAAEDAKFAEHSGFDWEGIAQAQERNRRRGRIVAGGSTITQQLAKNLFLSPAKNYWRKAQEAVITVLLEAMLSKERILELYLNVIEWGNGVFGVEAAARRYFGVDARRLSNEQAARLAAMAPAPRLFERNPESAYLAGRVATIMARMPAAQLP
jgi:monofunctional biosynthetic peptidoglycan transglycosylase